MIDKDSVKQIVENWHNCEPDPLRSAGYTKRCHIKQTIGHQTVAEHSFFVALLCWRLTDREPSEALLKAALFHDLAEIVTGDVPAPVKWMSKEIKEELEQMERVFDHVFHLEVSLSSKEEAILKLADLLELGWYCVDQKRLGNMNMEDVYKNVERAILERDMADIKNGWSEFNKLRSAYAVANTR